MSASGRRQEAQTGDERLSACLPPHAKTCPTACKHSPSPRHTTGPPPVRDWYIALPGDLDGPCTDMTLSGYHRHMAIDSEGGRCVSADIAAGISPAAALFHSLADETRLRIVPRLAP